MAYHVELDQGTLAGPTDIQPSFGLSLRSAVESTAVGNISQLSEDYAALQKANQGQKVPKAQADAIFKEAGVKQSAPDDGYTQDAIDILIKRRKREMELQRIDASTPWSWVGSPVRGGAMLLTGVVDPLNFASAFIPVVGEARAASLLARAGESILARLGTRAGIGAVEGLTGAALLEAPTYGLRTALQDDYRMSDSLLNLAFGAVGGAGLHGVGGFVGDALSGGNPYARYVGLSAKEVRQVMDFESGMLTDSTGFSPAQKRLIEPTPIPERSADIGAELGRRIQRDMPGAVAEYNALPGTDGGRILNTDEARELSPGYRANRTRSADVHEAASQFVKDLYAAKLAQPTPPDKQPLVLFTAGGTGAGKSSSLATPMGRQMYDAAEMVYDTNMNRLDSAIKKIEQALKAGRKVAIQYTFREPVDALVNGALPRAMRMGRTVPLVEHARTHTGAFETIAALREKYAGDPRVGIWAIDNSRGRGNQAVVEFDQLPKIADTGLEETLYAALKREHEAGRISDQVFAGTAAASLRSEGLGPAGRGARGGESAPADEIPAAISVAAASPETREAMMRAAVADFSVGRMPDVEALLRADPAVGDATIDQAARAAASQRLPEAAYLADRSAADAASKRAAEAPEPTDAETGLAEATERLEAMRRNLEATGIKREELERLTNIESFDEEVKRSKTIGEVAKIGAICGMRS